MARTSNGSLISVADAKSRLLELDRAGPGCPLSNPILRTGALLALGTVLGTALGRSARPDRPSWLRDSLMRFALSAAPGILEQLLQFHPDRASPAQPASP